jgi:hypothetical protein
LAASLEAHGAQRLMDARLVSGLFLIAVPGIVALIIFGAIVWSLIRGPKR